MTSKCLVGWKLFCNILAPNAAREMYDDFNPFKNANRNKSLLKCLRSLYERHFSDAFFLGALRLNYLHAG